MPRTNLPPETNAFVGRVHEIAQIAEQFEFARLVTLAGPGGIGKTRLARETARHVADRFPDGVWLVELAGLHGPDVVASAVAQVLGVRESAGRHLLDSLADAVADRGMLIVLDNCEHVVEACADLATSLLRASAGTRVLATSREVFGVDGEVVWAVPGLPWPEGAPTASEAAGNEAVRLFVDRARQSRRSFELTDANAAMIAALCRALDGLPLAIELAAARVSTLSVAELAARMGDRFRLLDGGGRGALPRHRTLRAALDWSYELLTLDEQTLLSRLSVFAGGFTLEAAEAVGSGPPVDELAVFDLLRRLVDKSLVVADEVGPAVRFRLLETVRVYAREKLFVSGEEAVRLRRHCQWCVDLAALAHSETEGPRRDEWNRRLETDHDNLRAALLRAIESRDAELALCLAGSLNRFWATAGFLSEGRQWIESALGVEGDGPPALRASALFGLSRLALIQADHRVAVSAADECLRIRRDLGDRAGEAAAIGIKALAVGRLGDYDEAYALQEHSLTISRELGLSREANEAVFYMGLLAMYRGDFERAQSHFEESLVAYRASDNRHKVVVLLHNVGEVAWFTGRTEAAREALEECLQLAAGLGLRRLVADTQRSLARAVGDRGDVDRAYELFRESLQLQREIGNREGVIEVIEGSACVAARQGQVRRAVALAAAARTVRAEMAIPPDVGFQTELDSRVEAAAQSMSRGEAEAARASGSAMTLDEAASAAVDPSWQ
ncbi:MAG: tetratricopeptide repeat protein [Blastocatellia bacterium]|nr:tetratricopeptide repeat protein [Blastocatellia bacterium]